MNLRQNVRVLTVLQHGVRTLRAPESTEGSAIMELIVTSLIAATLLLVGHLGVLVYGRVEEGLRRGRADGR
jgi:hypothetical protein